MKCPFCATYEDKVIETRVSKDGGEIRRRRECEGCTRRYTTYERIEESMPMVVKGDGTRQAFDRNKIARGIMASVVKRKVTVEQIQAIAEALEREIGELGVQEIQSRDIGERVLPRLRALDQVAYVRFASIYRDFRDVEGFVKEVADLRSSEGVEVVDGEDTGRHASVIALEDAASTADAVPEPASEERTDEHAAAAAAE